MPPSCLLLRLTASHSTAYLPSCHTSWLLHCLLSSSYCTAPLVVSLHQLVVASPLLVLLLCRPPVVSSHQLVLASPLLVLSLCRPLVLSLCRLVVASPLDAPPTCPLVALPSHPLSVPADCCIASCFLLLRRPLVFSSRWLVVALSLLASPSRPLIAPVGC
jgi:hypothetical protein